MTDTKNILRFDLEEIYEECQSITEAKSRALALNTDIFSISSGVKNQIHQFALEGAGIIANNASLIRHSTQTGLDGITYQQSVDEPDPVPVNEFDKEIPINGQCADEGQKLNKGIMDMVLFEIEDVDSEINRYTLVQSFIRSAMIHYILYKWYKTVGKIDVASIEKDEFDYFTGLVNFNAVKNQNRKAASRPIRFY
jgi:hypothetical protein